VPLRDRSDDSLEHAERGETTDLPFPSQEVVTANTSQAEQAEGSGDDQVSQLLRNPAALAEMLEASKGDLNVYDEGFVYVDSRGRVFRYAEAVEALSSAPQDPVVNAALQRLSEDEVSVVYERIAQGERWGEPWPAPAATLCRLRLRTQSLEAAESSGQTAAFKVMLRKDYGGFIRK
jgi:hypothetical protein